MQENPWAYNEKNNRLREQKERKERLYEELTEWFEKERIYMQSEKKFDIFELKHRIETGRSLLLLQKELSEALKQWEISRESFDYLSEKNISLHNHEKSEKISKIWTIIEDDIPFSDTELAHFFEKRKLWDNIFIDLGGFAYGFIVQGGAIFVILLFKIITDLISLPKDIYQELKK